VLKNHFSLRHNSIDPFKKLRLPSVPSACSVHGHWNRSKLSVCDGIRAIEIESGQPRSMPLQESVFIDLRTSERFQRFAPTVQSLQHSGDACRLMVQCGHAPYPSTEIPPGVLKPVWLSEKKRSMGRFV